MARLKTAAADLSTFQFEFDSEKAAFNSVDLLCAGDLDKMDSYTNSLTFAYGNAFVSCKTGRSHFNY